MVSPHRADGNLLLVVVILCLCCAPVTCKNSETEVSIQNIFQHYASKEGEKNLMNYSEFEAFMKTELKSFTENQDSKILRNFMESVDGAVDGKMDGELNFQEFINLFGRIIVDFQNALKRYLKSV